MSQRTTFLGPEGTFCEQALLSQPDLAAGHCLPSPSILAALLAVIDDEADAAFVPIENAIEGTVNVTLDALAFDLDLLIQREVLLDIRFDLLAPEGTTLSSIERVVTFPHAAAQCRSWLRSNLPDAVVSVEHVNSTAEAAATVAGAADRRTAAIANPRAGEVYGLTALATDLADHPGNETRFVLVAPGRIPAPTGHDLTSIVVFQQADRPGSLLAILQEFAARGINLRLLESRPTKRGLGDYCFIIHLEGHIADEVVADCLATLKAKQADVRFLGSYPSAAGEGPTRRREADAAEKAAAAWLTELRTHID